jgi:death-on-curing protein
MTEPRWISHALLLAIHEAQIAEHGGTLGIRDQGRLQFVLARPRQIFKNAKAPTLARLAATYAFGMTQTPPFLDGNERTGWIACAAFLEMNGRRVTATQADAFTAMTGVASQSIDKDRFTDWLERNSE